MVWGASAFGAGAPHLAFLRCVYLSIPQISEFVLHWIWKNRLYNPQALRTLTGEPVFIQSPGKPQPQGPDFAEAQVQIGNLLWIGHVEIDVHPGLWEAHKHHESPAYRSVILHVVWRSPSGASTQDIDGRTVPILPLAPAVPTEVLERVLPKSLAFPCGGIARLLPAEVWWDFYDQWGEKRLRSRHHTYRNEEELVQAFWRALLYSFGVPEGEPYQAIAHALPWPLLNRYAEDLLAKEAALLGTAGLLEGVSPPVEPYERALLERWEYLRRKLGWRPLSLRWHIRRPAASPWVRLAQVAALVDGYPNLLTLFLHPPAEVPLPSPYWQKHWAWQRPFRSPLRRPSPLLYQNLLINAIYPFAIYYLRSIGRIEEALGVLDRFRSLPPETHRYARQYAAYAYPAQNAWQTQGQIQLWREACQKQACLSCRIGQLLLQR
ncbi:MAG: DUF2851 family protein [Bacteroidia bacterium]|nr:DUF2851 family protein [Bacteroidia bacterium]